MRRILVDDDFVDSPILSKKVWPAQDLVRGTHHHDMRQAVLASSQSQEEDETLNTEMQSP